MLYERAWASRNGWRLLKLVKAGKRRGRAWMGVNQRIALARNRDTASLRLPRPEVYTWVIRVMSAGDAREFG